MTDWHSGKSAQLYNTPHWGEGYFGVNDAGHVVVRPCPENGHEIDLYRVAQQFAAQHLSLPVLVRFTDILGHRARMLQQSFADAIAASGYHGHYRALYPIKVNQQHSVVSELLHQGVGLEAGSKPELMAVLGISPPGGVIVCNGYKDQEYIRLALIGQQLGQRVFIVVEKLSELALVLQQSRALGVAPRLGIRVRLASIGAGNWQNSGGEKSKFGLSAAQLLDAVARLKQAGMLDTLRMLHFHLGSQLVDILDVRRGMAECARIYGELRRMGVAIECLDVGGGLGVDYEGTRSRNACSMNYSVQDYAAQIVATIHAVCEQHGLPHPDIFTESGRAMTAHHAVLVTNVIDTEQVPQGDVLAPLADAAPLPLQQLRQHQQRLQQSVEAAEAIEIYTASVQIVADANQAFNRGELTLVQRAHWEHVYFAICGRVQEILASQEGNHQTVLDEIRQKMADKYFCNFSLFQSVPDIWGIEQIFPVMPLHRLEQAPTRRAVLEDITCDSDGRIDRFVEAAGIEGSVPLHPLQPGEDYLLGIFLVGAYQEILGDMHNLFGDTDSVHVSLNPDGSYHFSELRQGDSIDAVLRYVHFNPDDLLQQYRHKVAQAGINDAQRKEYLRMLEVGLHGYTYLDKNTE